MHSICSFTDMFSLLHLRRRPSGRRLPRPEGSRFCSTDDPTHDCSGLCVAGCRNSLFSLAISFNTLEHPGWRELCAAGVLGPSDIPSSTDRGDAPPMQVFPLTQPSRPMIRHHKHLRFHPLLLYKRFPVVREAGSTARFGQSRTTSGERADDHHSSP